MRKILLLVFILMLVVSAKAANPAFQDFNTNQHSTTGNKVAIRVSALMTNVHHHRDLIITNNADIRLYAWENAGAVTAAVGAAGALTGQYGYAAVFYNSFGQSGGSDPANFVDVVSQRITVSGIPLGPTGTVGRKIYRTTALGEGDSFFFLTNIANNTTTTFSDNTTDANLGAGIGLNTLGGAIFIEDAPILRYFGQNVFLGASAGSNHISGNANVFVGDLAGRDAKTNINNVILGFETARSASTMNGNILILGAMSEATGNLQFNNVLGQDGFDYATNSIGNNGMGRDIAFRATNAQLNTIFGDFSMEDVWGLTNVVGMGARATVGPNFIHDSAWIGTFTEITADNQLIVGGTNSGGGFNEGYFGQGYTNHFSDPPAGFLFSATGAAGNNNTGGPLKLQGGRSTGENPGAPIHFLVSAAGASGVTLNPGLTNMTIAHDGVLAYSNITARGALISEGQPPLLQLRSTNLVGAIGWTLPSGNYQPTNVHIMNGSNFSGGQIWAVASVSGNEVTWTNGAAPAGGGSSTNFDNITVTNVTRHNGPVVSTKILATYVGTNVVINGALGDHHYFILTNTLTGLTVTNVIDGQKIQIDCIQDATGGRDISLVNQTLGTATNFWNGGVEITVPTPPVMGIWTNAHKMTKLKVEYVAGIVGVQNSTNRLDLVGFIRGY